MLFSGSIDRVEAKRKSAAELAFIGDAVYELLVRKLITVNIDTTPATLHRTAVSYVCAEAQSEALEAVVTLLSEDELDVVRRGKNSSKLSVPRHGSPRTYRSATALEALFGYLYLAGDYERLETLFSLACEARNKREAK